MKDLLIRLEKLIELRQAIQNRYEETENPVEAKSIPYSQEESFLQKVKQVVDEKIGDDDLDLNYLSKAVHLSPTQLFRKMKALTNLSPMSFVRKIRLHKAKELIETTSLNISEVAYDLGFNDPNYFSRAFRKEFDFPPTKIRKMTFSSL